MKKIIQIPALMFLSGIAQADIYSDAEDIMNEKESVFQNYFPSHQQTIIAPPWLYRYYPETNNYQGINIEDGLHYVMGSDFFSDIPIISDSNIHGAQFNHSSDEGEFGFKFSLHTVDGSPLHTVEDEYGVKYAKLVIGKNYRITGEVPPQLYAMTSYLVLEHQAVGEDTWVAIRKFKLANRPDFDQTFTLPNTTHLRGKWRLRSFNEEGLEGTVEPAVVSGTLSAEADLVITWNLTNDTKSDLIVHYPTQKLITGEFCTSEFTLLAGETARTTITNPGDWSGMTWYANRVKSGAITDNYTMRWDHKVSGYDACSSPEANFVMESGGVYNMRLTPRALSSGFDAFVWSDGSSVCSAGWLTNFGYSLADHTSNFIEAVIVDTGWAVAIAGMGYACVTTVAACFATGGLVTTEVNSLYKQTSQLVKDLPPSCP